MDTCLIAWLDRNTNVGNRCGYAVNNRILGLPGGVCIEIEDIVVLDAVVGRTPTQGYLRVVPAGMAATICAIV